MTDSGTEPAAPSQQSPQPSQPETQKVPLLDVLHDLGSTLTQSELPTPASLQHVVGAIVKVMDHAKVEVADELWPAEPVQVQRPETVDATHRQQTNDRLNRIEEFLGELADHIRGGSSSSSGSSSEENK